MERKPLPQKYPTQPIPIQNALKSVAKYLKNIDSNEVTLAIEHWPKCKRDSKLIPPARVYRALMVNEPSSYCSDNCKKLMIARKTKQRKRTLQRESEAFTRALTGVELVSEAAIAPAEVLYKEVYVPQLGIYKRIPID